MSLRILHILPSLAASGAHTQAALLISQLPPEEFEVGLAVVAGQPQATSVSHSAGSAGIAEQGLPVWEAGQLRPGDFSAWLRLLRIIRKFKPQLVHTWGASANTYGRLAACAAKVPLMVARESYIRPPAGAGLHYLEQKLARRTQRVIVNTEEIARHYRHRYRTEPAQVQVIRNGVRSPEEMLAGQQPAVSLKHELGIPEHCRLIGVVGPLESRKRLKEVLWGADQINAARGEDTRVILVGQGPQLSWLQHYARLFHAEKYVHFLGQRDDVLQLLPQFDVLWQSSPHEGQPNAILEAMACGVPVVATDIPGHRELVVHEQTGFLIPLNVRSAFARMTDRILNRPDLVAQFSQAAVERSRGFSVSAMVQSHIKLYRELQTGG